MKYQEIFKKLWINYHSLNPTVDKIQKILLHRGEDIINDHIAFRAYDIAGIDLETLAIPFKNAGYIEKGNYNFKEKKLNAKHYEHTEDKKAPKVFISELRTQEFTPLIKETAKWLANVVQRENIPIAELLFSNRSWNPISYACYEELRSESEYAAWLYVFGFRANHFTVYVNYLNSINSLEELNIVLKENNISLNSAGGEIKGSKELLLQQSSTLADEVKVEFIEGVFSIPCCYYEFAERFVGKDNELFTGFLAKSADKIFESTHKK